MGRGWRGAALAMMRVLLLTGLLSERGYGQLGGEAMASARRAIAAVLEAGELSGCWRLDDSVYRQYAGIVTMHDAQLGTAPRGEYDAAMGQLGRLLDARRKEAGNAAG